MSLPKGDYVWQAEGGDDWSTEGGRFFDGLAHLDRELAVEGAFSGSVEKLIRGPLADALTHVGQLAMRGSADPPESYARGGNPRRTRRPRAGTTTPRVRRRRQRQAALSVAAPPLEEQPVVILILISPGSRVPGRG